MKEKVALLVLGAILLAMILVLGQSMLPDHFTMVVLTPTRDVTRAMAPYPGVGVGGGMVSAAAEVGATACAVCATCTPSAVPATPTPTRTSTPTATRTATAMPSPTWTPLRVTVCTDVEVTRTPGAAATAPPEPTAAALPARLPVLFRFMDLQGIDWQTLHPEYGPIGSVHQVVWEWINPSAGVYDWSSIDKLLANEAGLKVTLHTGQVVPKPVELQVQVYLVNAYGWPTSNGFYDATPRWVYDQVDWANPQAPRPIIGGRKVGHKLESAGAMTGVPAYDEATWRNAFAAMVTALGARYNGHPQIAAVDICTGIDGETQPIKIANYSPDWPRTLDVQAPGVNYRFGQWVYSAMDAYRAAFPGKPVYIMNAAGGAGVRAATSDYAKQIGAGIKSNNLEPDNGSWQGYGEYVGGFDKIAQYSTTVDIWLESKSGNGDAMHVLWSFFAALHYHPDGIDVHPEWITRARPEWLRWVSAHIGVTLADTPSVWTVLRDAEYPVTMWPGGAAGNSGKVGDWQFWMYRERGGARVMRNEIPGAQTDPRSRQARKLSGAETMTFQVEPGFAGASLTITILNVGTDTFSVSAGAGTLVFAKGPALGPVGEWVEVTLPMTAQAFTIAARGDGPEHIHRVELFRRAEPVALAVDCLWVSANGAEYRPCPTPPRIDTGPVLVRAGVRYDALAHVAEVLE